MSISAESVKVLRDKTGISIMECKKALEHTQGDMDKALEVLAERAEVSLLKKAGRDLCAGTVGSYIHNAGQIGAMVLLSCETDFVSKNEEFVALAKDIAMQAVAMRASSKDELLEQAFIKDESKSIKDLITNASHKFGERVELAALSVLNV